MIKKINQNQGLIRTILIIIIAVIILGYFRIDIRGVWNSPTVQNNLNFLWESTQYLWKSYLKEPANFLYGIFYNYLWFSFIENMERIREGESTTIIEDLPQTFEVPAVQY